MIELLVALVIMGVGVLGLTGLGMLSLQQGRTAWARADAVRLAQDMMERVRANPAGLEQGAYVLAGSPPSAPDCRAIQCSAAQMAAFDLAAWACSLGADNAAGDCPAPMRAQGEVSTNLAGHVRIAISWSERGATRTLVVEGGG